MTDKSIFRNSFAENVFNFKYAKFPGETWAERAKDIVEDVVGTQWGKSQALMCKEDRDQLEQYIREMKMIPGGRYVWYSGRGHSFWNNCFLLRAEEDTREEWGAVMQRAVSCLMTGGGIGIDYSILREAGRSLSRTGGIASGPLPLMQMVNEAGRGVMQGGSRRSAIYASLNWQHKDIEAFLKVKNWNELTQQQKALDFNYPAPLDMTNISVNYDDASLGGYTKDTTGAVVDSELATNPIFLQNVRQAMETGEPGFSFNFGDKQNETLRNACTEVTSEDDSDVCNLGSINLGTIGSLEEFRSVVNLASKFLVCGTLRADLPYDKVYKVREKNRRLGLGLMGIHEWLLKRGYKYEVTPELHEWLKVYQQESEKAANEHCDRFFISRPVAYRAIAPTGSIGILAGTSTGIEPLFAVAYKRRFLTEGTKWKYQFVVDGTAATLIKDFGVDPYKIESAIDLSAKYEQRVKFQFDVQKYVDMSISSTINLPAWGTEYNNEGTVDAFAKTLAKYAPGLRGFTCYPDGSRGGQPLTSVPYEEALKHKDVVYDEIDICEYTGKGGSCGV
jgi:ribonucleoside-diphosphate reductase alpha chain